MENENQETSVSNPEERAPRPLYFPFDKKGIVIDLEVVREHALGLAVSETPLEYWDTLWEDFEAASFDAGDPPPVRDVSSASLGRAIGVNRFLTVFRAGSAVAYDHHPEESKTTVIDGVWPGHLPGLHVIAGRARQGKSEYISNTLTPDVTIRWGEPFERFDMSDNAIHVRDLSQLIYASLVWGMAGYLVAVDSLRKMVFAAGGNAGAGGVTVGLYDVLTDLNNMFAAMHVVVVAAVNPMMTEEKADEVYSNIEASVAGLTVVGDGSVRYVTYRGHDGRYSSVGQDQALPMTDRRDLPPPFTEAAPLRATNGRRVPSATLLYATEESPKTGFSEQLNYDDNDDSSVPRAGVSHTFLGK